MKLIIGNSTDNLQMEEDDYTLGIKTPSSLFSSNQKERYSWTLCKLRQHLLGGRGSVAEKTCTNHLHIGKALRSRDAALECDWLRHTAEGELYTWTEAQGSQQQCGEGAPQL